MEKNILVKTVAKSGYKVFYTSEGVKVKIKVTKDALCRSGTFIFKIKNEKTIKTIYHSPNRLFDNVIEAIEFILQNVETKHLKFKII